MDPSNRARTTLADTPRHPESFVTWHPRRQEASSHAPPAIGGAAPRVTPLAWDGGRPFGERPTRDPTLLRAHLPSPDPHRGAGKSTGEEARSAEHRGTL